MRLRSLDFAGIGPFAGKEHIDFEAFEASGIFLLRGNTGAGKSTLVDAITFALYGDVARGHDSDKARLRSTYSPPEAPSVVELVFETPRGIFRVRRTPSYERPGRKTAVNATVRLERVAEDKSGGFICVEAISSNIQEANRELGILVGLTKEQFLQTVVLPQGKFATFLSATSTEREKILRDIFGASLFSAVEKSLREAANHGNKTVERSCIRLGNSLAVFRNLLTESGHAPKTDPNSADADLFSRPVPVEECVCLSPEETLDACDRHLNVLAEEISALQSLCVPLEEKNSTASKELEEARALHTLLDEYAALCARRESLDGQAEKMADARSRLHQHARCVGVVPLIDEVRAARTDADDAKELTITRVNDLSCLCDTAFDTTDLTRLIQQFNDLEHQTLADKTRAEELCELEKRVGAARDEQKKTCELIVSEKERLSGSEEILRSLPQTIANHEKELEELRTQAASIDASKERLKACEQRLDAAHRADILRANLPNVSEEVTKATLASHNAHEKASLLHRMWLSNAAAALADTLEADTPCPVCGSQTHPHPASSSGSDAQEARVSHDDVLAATEASTQADRLLEEARNAHKRAVDSIVDLNKQAGCDSETLKVERDALRQNIADAQVALDSAAVLRSQLVEERACLTATEEQSAHLRESLAALGASLSALSEAINHDTQRLAASLPQGISAGAHSERLTRLLDLCGSAKDSAYAWEQAHTRLTEAEEKRDKALTDAGFNPDEEGILTVEHSVMDNERAEAMTQMIEEYDRSVSSVLDQLSQERMKSCEGQEKPDITSLEKVHAECVQSLTDHRNALAVAEARLDSLRSARAEIRAALQKLTEAQHSAGPARRLAALASASGPENLKATPLTSWVLMSRFQDVLDAANPRLLEISSGRYELQSCLDDGTRSRKSGLGLRVLDHDTEETRPTRSLSGGETFYTSLALALGLSDVVTAESGGVELRTLFIDEGFGSLDAATLDVVMGQLEALRNRGRTVGVISHVDELARRILEQIHVTWTPTCGSTLTVRA